MIFFGYFQLSYIVQAPDAAIGRFRERKRKRRRRLTPWRRHRTKGKGEKKGTSFVLNPSASAFNRAGGGENKERGKKGKKGNMDDTSDRKGKPDLPVE